jgi:alkylated DNA repair dioxygenase AlkB
VAVRQLGLLAPTEHGFDASFSRLKRTELAHGAWLDYAQGWLGDHSALFESLLQNSAWQTSEQHLYDRSVVTPRLIAAMAPEQPLPELLASMQELLSQRYQQRFERVALALYRDGRDSVAFHGDRIAREMPNALVATVSVGAPRRFLLRPHPDMPAVDRRSLAFNLGWGDLLVMGGSCQRTWQHAIPKVRHAEPRIAIMFRPVWKPTP